MIVAHGSDDTMALRAAPRDVFAEVLTQVPDVGMYPLDYVMEVLKPRKPDDENLWLEFGVYSGNTINYIAKCADGGDVHGFDSFRGLPSKWRDGYDKGTFDKGGRTPPVSPNVHLVVGWFEETLEPFLAQRPNASVSFIHIDCDLYSSAKYVLDTLAPRMAPGCLIVFDELVNFAEYASDASELRALHEFVNENDVEWAWVGINGKVGQLGDFGICSPTAIRIDKVVPRGPAAGRV